jgi:hypothetical protein
MRGCILRPVFRPRPCSGIVRSRHGSRRVAATAWRCDCSGRRRRSASLSRTSYSITSRRRGLIFRWRGATGRPCFELAAGIGGPASPRCRSSPPAASRNRCSICPVTRMCSISSRATPLPPIPQPRGSPGVSPPRPGGIDLPFRRLCPYNPEMAQRPLGPACRLRISG